MEIRLLAPSEYPLMLPLVAALNPNTDPELLATRLQQLDQGGYECAGAFIDGKLIAICGIWTLVKVYSGLQMEIDNVAVDERFRNQKIGDQLMQWVYEYAKSKGCYSVELNAYVSNSKAHKFYMNQGFRILGFHMQKVL